LGHVAALSADRYLGRRLVDKVCEGLQNLRCLKQTEISLWSRVIYYVKFKFCHTVLMVKRGNLNQRSRRVYLTGGCTGRFTKTLKMVKSAYIN
jgi:hypothetical protein